VKFTLLTLATIKNSEEVREATRQVLDNDLYRYADKNTIQDWTEVFSWFSDGLESVFRWLNKLTPGLKMVIVIVCLVLLALIVWHIVYTFKRAFRVNPVKSVLSSQRKNLLAEIQLSLNESIRNQQWNLAIRHNFLQSILILDKKEKISFVRSMTNQELVNAIPSGSLNQHFNQLISEVDCYWYARNQAKENDYQRVKELCLNILK
jgi:hypothetical protein